MSKCYHVEFRYRGSDEPVRGPQVEKILDEMNINMHFYNDRWVTSDLASMIRTLFKEIEILKAKIAVLEESK